MARLRTQNDRCNFSKRKHSMFLKEKCTHILFVFAFFAVLIGSAIISAAAEDQTFSRQELRHLAQFPAADWESLADGTWFLEFEAYCKDQFVQREQCMDSYYAFLDFMQVKERNGYVLGKNNQILNVRGSYTTPGDIAYASEYYGAEQIEAMRNIADSAKEYGGEVIYMNIPYRMEFYADMYPALYENGKELNDAMRESIIRKAKQAGIPVVETYQLLRSHEEEFIFFTTDHHWTIRGAYYGYLALLDCINELDPSLKLRFPDFSELNISARNERMVGSYLRTWGDGGTINNDYLEYAIPYDMPDYTRYESGDPSDLPLMDTSKNNYTTFMSGDFANTFIDTGREDLPSILFIGFSYTNPLEMMSVYNFGTVASLDPRLFTGSICEYIQENRPDYIVIVKDDIYEGNYEFSCTVG